MTERLRKGALLLDFLQMLVVLDGQRRLSVFVEWKTF
jgi:hypothetical protein